ncbi:hypothetical protein HU200_044529 [Digitaria exilis]|uniref:non-specific serine/threonine protein kinase n=1 Tax=Digitaria exilis TaxID=1010633 RepID=A0A835B6Z4_9POAL|nr:hypothetical protein HU200_044529 [Digitaria exilis]
MQLFHIAKHFTLGPPISSLTPWPDIPKGAGNEIPYDAAKSAPEFPGSMNNLPPPPLRYIRLGSHHPRTEPHMNPISPVGLRGSGGGVTADLLMDLTNSAAEGWRMRSRKSCQASGAVEDPKASPPPSIVAGSGGLEISGLLGSAEDGEGGSQGFKGRRRWTDDAANFCRAKGVCVTGSRRVRPSKDGSARQLDLPMKATFFHFIPTLQLPCTANLRPSTRHNKINRDSTDYLTVSRIVPCAPYKYSEMAQSTAAWVYEFVAPPRSAPPPLAPELALLIIRRGERHALRGRVSSGGQFELGFFSPSGGNSNSNYYVGIWYKRIPGRTVIWVMNRDSPITDPSSAELTVAPDGNLLLLTRNRPQEAIWSSNSTGSRGGGDDDTAVAVLLDSGNLVLRGRCGNSSAVVWQNFDHPTDTLVPGGWVGLNKSNGAYQALRSWRSATDPSTGLYTDRVDPRGSGQYEFLWNETAAYHYIGSWNGRYFVPIPEMVMSDKYTFIFVNNSEEVSYSFKVNDPSTVSRLVMSPHGQLTMFDWSDGSGQWLLHWATPTSQCDVYSVCGPFGLCDVASSQYCRCLPGFEPASPGDWVSQTWSAGCARKTSLQCSGNASSTTDGFLPVQNVQLPSSNSTGPHGGSSGDCASACLRNCSCTAYAYYRGVCFVWGDDLRNAQQLAAVDAGASTLFIRVAAADLAAANHGASTNNVRVALLGVSCVVLTILCLLFVLAWVRRREGTVHPDGSLLVFSHGYLAQCTKNFSHKLGSGSFGSVYKGTLPNHTAIAVKRLEGSAQGEKQFRTEVRTLGTIQHVNLVRLRGFCATRDERLLVYDYMPNGSLASVLSSGHGFRLLDWRARFGIMSGVARGLAYLHEQCHERIVHCDVKPENILLDAGFCPKVADFGMAKLIVRDFSKALTTTRGTVGYLAPEWILGLPITAKADVFSYGMMLLELISGRRNRDAAGAGRRYFPLWAATKVREGQFLALLDERLAGDADVEELGRACNQSEAVRPTMGQVVQVLEGSLRVATAPVPRFLEQLCAEDSCTYFHSSAGE